MDTKLKLVLQTPYLPLLLSTVFFGGILFWFVSGSQGFFSVLLFILVAWYLYAQSLFTHVALWDFFLILLVLVVITSFVAAHYMYALVPLFLVSWAILIGLERLVFIDRHFWSYILSVILFLILISLYLISGDHIGISGFFNAGLFIIGATLLFRALHLATFTVLSKSLLFSVVGALLLFELLWALLLLPLNLFSVLVLCLLFSASYALCYRPSWLLHLLIFILFFILIVLTTHWRL